MLDMRRLLLFTTLLLSCLVSMAQENDNNTILGDSTTTYSEVADTLYIPQVAIELLGDTPTVYVAPLGQRIYENKYFQMTYIGVPLVIAGIASQNYVADKFYNLRNAYTPNFKFPLDDYMQYAPAVAMLAMKACGVKGRSSWGRMIVSDVFSVALVAGVVNGLKYTVGTLRPDGSRHNSFPSGHTATAFAAAHLLHKEYGGISPWISVAGYSIASFVGVSRILNNRHWISDVLAGAGIGLLSVEFGYFFADLIFKEKGIDHYFDTPDFTIPTHPSHVGLTMGLSLPLAPLFIGDGQQLTFTTGSRMGVEGAWYITPNVGIGGIAAVAWQPGYLDSNPEEAISFSTSTIAAGVYGSIPLAQESRFRFNMKGLAGCNIINNTQLMPGTMVTSPAGFYYELGASFSVVARRGFGANIFCDYGGHLFTATHTPHGELGLSRSGEFHYIMHTATVGVSTSILF